MTKNTLTKIAIVALVLAGIGAFVYFMLAWPSSEGENGGGGGDDVVVNFDETGNLVKNNPGFNPNAWYVVYESAGQPALSAELAFSGDVVCTFEDTGEDCDVRDIEQGTRARIEGVRDEEGAVTVERVTILDEASAGNDLIRVTSPQPNTSISTPLPITGQARGTWFFEASFPVRMLDGDGNEIGAGFVEAQEDWMTEEFVPFEGSLRFDMPDTETGTLVLERANPSGLPENASEIRVPVRFYSAERTVEVYYYNPSFDKDASGNVQCSRKGLVAVERVIPITQTPIQDTIEVLLRGELTPQEESEGVETEFPLKGFELVGANLEKGGELTLEFDDSQNASSGGSCRASILWYQIEATALQFPEVREVRFIPEELFQP